MLDPMRAAVQVGMVTRTRSSACRVRPARRCSRALHGAPGVGRRARLACCLLAVSGQRAHDQLVAEGRTCPRPTIRPCARAEHLHQLQARRSWTPHLLVVARVALRRHHGVFYVLQFLLRPTRLAALARSLWQQRPHYFQRMVICRWSTRAMLAARHAALVRSRQVIWTKNVGERDWPVQRSSSWSIGHRNYRRLFANRDASSGSIDEGERTPGEPSASSSTRPARAALPPYFPEAASGVARDWPCVTSGPSTSSPSSSATKVQLTNNRGLVAKGELLVKNGEAFERTFGSTSPAKNGSPVLRSRR